MVCTEYQYRSPEVFCKNGVLGNFEKFIGKHLCQISFLIKLRVKTCSFIKKETLALAFSCEFWEISKSTFFYRTPSVTASVNKKIVFSKDQRAKKSLDENLKLLVMWYIPTISGSTTFESCWKWL